MKLNKLIGVMALILLPLNLKAAEAEKKLNKDLINAVVNSDLKKVNAVLSQGVNPNDKEFSETPLQIASDIPENEIRIEIVRALIKAKADLNRKAPFEGKTALLLALNRGNLEVAKLLINAGADVNIADNQGVNSLISLFYNINTIEYKKLLELFDLLLKAGAKINEQDNAGYTVLIYAAKYYDNPKLVRLLLDNGADYNIKDKEGKSFLDYVAQKPEIAKAFAEYEAVVAAESAKVCKEVFDAIPTFPKPIANMVAEYVHSCPKDL